MVMEVSFSQSQLLQTNPEELYDLQHNFLKRLNKFSAKSFFFNKILNFIQEKRFSINLTDQDITSSMSMDQYVNEDQLIKQYQMLRGKKNVFRLLLVDRIKDSLPILDIKELLDQSKTFAQKTSTIPQKFDLEEKYTKFFFRILVEKAQILEEDHVASCHNNPSKRAKTSTNSPTFPLSNQTEEEEEPEVRATSSYKEPEPNLFAPVYNATGFVKQISLTDTSLISLCQKANPKTSSFYEWDKPFKAEAEPRIDAGHEIIESFAHNGRYFCFIETKKGEPGLHIHSHERSRNTIRKYSHLAQGIDFLSQPTNLKIAINHIAISFWDGYLVLYDIEKKISSKHSIHTNQPIYALDINEQKDEKLMVLTGSSDKLARLTRIKDKETSTINFKGHTKTVTTARLYDDFALTGSKDSTVQFWDLHTGTHRSNINVQQEVADATYRNSEIFVRFIKMNQSNNTLYNYMKAFDTRSKQVTRQFSIEATNEQISTFVIENDFLLIGTTSGNIHSYKL
jgi:WD40 repeat protein